MQIQQACIRDCPLCTWTPAANINQHLPATSGLQQTSCTLLLLSINRTDGWMSYHTQTLTATSGQCQKGTTRVSRYQKGKTNLDFTGARDSEWQWHQLGHVQVLTSLQTDNHASTPPLCSLQAGCPSCHPTNSVKALKANQSTEGKVMCIW